MLTLSRLCLVAALTMGGALAQSVAASAADYTVVMNNMAFGPVPAELRAGDTIIWQNNDIFRHTATARDASFDVDLPAKAEVRMVVGAAGTVEFFCRFHPGMVGTLVIAP